MNLAVPFSQVVNEEVKKFVLLPSPHPHSWFVLLQVAAAFVKYPPALKGKLIFQAFWGMSCKLETAVLALGRAHCHLWPPPSHRCLRPVFGSDSFQGPQVPQVLLNFWAFLVSVPGLTAFPREFPVSYTILFSYLFFQEVRNTKLRNGPNSAHCCCAPPSHFLAAEKRLSASSFSSVQQGHAERHCRFPPLQISHITSSLSSAPRGQMI